MSDYHKDLIDGIVETLNDYKDNLKAEFSEGAAGEIASEIAFLVNGLNPWIPVKERLPLGDGYYFVYSMTRGMEIFYYWKDDRKGCEFSGDPTITHWMPLPPRPKEIPL